jgi:precorrin-6B methylase 2
MITDAPDVVRKLLTERPLFHLNGAARWDALPQTLEHLRRSVRPGDVTLEVGAGASTVVFAAAGAQHTVITPDPAERRLILDYCERSGTGCDNLRFKVGCSEDVLPTLLGGERFLDVAFIDGSHNFPLPVIDWFYVSRSLKPGGKLIVDDIAIPAAGQIYRHMQLEPEWRLDKVLDDRAAAFTLLAAAEGYDDWVDQPFNRGYPDFSFVALPRRLRVRAAWRRREFRRAVGQHAPGLRRICRRGA